MCQVTAKGAPAPTHLCNFLTMCVLNVLCLATPLNSACQQICMLAAFTSAYHPACQVLLHACC